MKRILFLGVVIGTLLSAGFSLAGTRAGTVELSLSPAFENVKVDNNSETIIMLPVRVGVFATSMFEIEGDMNLTSLENSTGLWLFLNAVFNFDTGEGKVRPFILGGVGFGNAGRILGLALETDESVFGFDLGAGIKAPITDRVSFRAEYRFDRVSLDAGGGDITIQGNRVLMGFSVFFATDAE